MLDLTYNQKLSILNYKKGCFLNNNSSLTIAPIARGTAPDRAAQKRFFVVGIAMFVMAAGLLAVRLLSAYLPLPADTPAQIAVTDLIFSVLVQIVILFLTTFLIYKFALKMRAREVLEFSNYRKTKWYNCALAVPLGILALFVTLGISTFWLVILMSAGYMPPPDAALYPEVFSPGLFLLEIALTALLPALCEEFAMRGGLFTVLKKSYKGVMLYVLMSVAFGLFHQNIRQVFYTALFGGFMTFLLIKTKSIWPCVIVHFMNNFSSVYLDYASQYGWFGGNLLDYLFSDAGFVVVMVLFAGVSAALAGLMAAIHYLNGNKTLKAKKETILDSGFNHTQNRVVLVGEENPEKVRELDMEKEVYGGKLPENLYKPKLKDAAFFIGAIVIAAAYTLFSFIFGFFY